MKNLKMQVSVYNRTKQHLYLTIYCTKNSKKERLKKVKKVKNKESKKTNRFSKR